MKVFSELREQKRKENVLSKTDDDATDSDRATREPDGDLSETQNGRK
jgi:hypothetical protein